MLEERNEKEIMDGRRSKRRMDGEKAQAERLRSRLMEIMSAYQRYFGGTAKHHRSLVKMNKPEQINNPDVYRMMLL